MMITTLVLMMNFHPTYLSTAVCATHLQHHHSHVIARYKETIVTIANRKEVMDRMVGTQKKELQ